MESDFVSLHKELRIVCKAWENQFTQKSGPKTNAAGIKVAKNLSGAKLIANLSQAIESQIILEASRAAITPLVLIHDALICAEPENIESMQARVKKVTGITVKFEQEPI